MYLNMHRHWMCLHARPLVTHSHTQPRTHTQYPSLAHAGPASVLAPDKYVFHVLPLRMQACSSTLQHSRSRAAALDLQVWATWHTAHSALHTHTGIPTSHKTVRLLLAQHAARNAPALHLQPGGITTTHSATSTSHNGSVCTDAPAGFFRCRRSIQSQAPPQGLIPAAQRPSNCNRGCSSLSHPESLTTNMWGHVAPGLGPHPGPCTKELRGLQSSHCMHPATAAQVSTRCIPAASAPPTAVCPLLRSPRLNTHDVPLRQLVRACS
jgi:hypothetical protein